MASTNALRKNRVTHANAITHQGGKGVTFTSRDELNRIATNCYLFEDTYYRNGVDIAEQLVRLVQGSDVTVKDVLDIAANARAAHLRHTPLWLLNALIVAKKTSDESHSMRWQDIMPFLTRPDQATELLAMYWVAVGKSKPIPAMYKKAFREYITTLSRYQLAKYKQADKEVQLRDVVRISRPRPLNEKQSQDFSDLIMNTLPNEETWEAKLSVPGADKKAVWSSMLKDGSLGDMAIIRNVRNMMQAGVDQVTIGNAIRNIKSKYITAGQIVQAYKTTPDFTAEYDELFAKLFGTTDRFAAEIVIMVDVSGSMNDKLAKRGETKRYEVAAGLAAQLANAFARSHVYAFDNDDRKANGRNILLVKELCDQVGGGTDCYGTWSRIAKLYPNAHLVMITDEQDGGYYTRGLRVSEFKAKKASFIINVAPYEIGLAMPENNIERINGWSDKIPAYIVERIKGNGEDLV